MYHKNNKILVSARPVQSTKILQNIIQIYSLYERIKYQNIQQHRKNTDKIYTDIF